MTTSASIWHGPSHSEPQTSQLSARQPELARLDQLLRHAAVGSGAVLRVIGERGIGKSAILDYAAQRASGYRLLQVRAVASERELPYAGLHLLCAPLLEDIHALPAAHREALTTAVGLTAGQTPDRFAVSLAILNLLAGIASSQPLCVIVDDAHWLDHASAQIFAFVARRIDRHALLILLAEDEQQRLTELDGLPEMHLQPLPWADAHILLSATAPGRLDDMVVERILTETRGNPLAIVKAFDGVTAAECAGGFAIPAPRQGLPCAAGHDCLERAQQLPAEARRLLLMAAAEPTGDPALTWRAAARLRIGPERAELLETQNLLVFGIRTMFACPGLRPVLYGSAAASERRQVHQALAEAATEPVSRAWHLALAATGLDDTLADDLERCVPQAQLRGGTAARAAFLEKATLLTGNPSRRAGRALAAAAAKHDAGAPEAAQRLLAIVESGLDDPARLARAAWQRARIHSTVSRGDANAKHLLGAARRLESFEPAAAREAYLEALLAAMSAAHLTTEASEPSTVDVARVALAAATAPQPQPIDQLLYGLATRALGGYPAGVARLTCAMTAFRDNELDCRSARWLGLASWVAADLWDDRAWTALTRRQTQLAASANLATQIGDCAYQALAELHLGQFDAAHARLTRAGAHAPATAAASVSFPALLLYAWQGKRSMVDNLLPGASQDARDHRDGITLTAASLSVALLHNSLGRYDQAVDAARHAAQSDHLGLSGWALTELVEAAARAGQRDVAEDAAERLAERTGAAETDWALSGQATSRALLVDGHPAEALYQEAIDRLSRTEIRPQLARAQLLYGEWLRRRNRRIDARAQLRAAHDLFAAIGASAFADRAHRELLATGESARKRTVGTERRLTPQESRVAYLARDGLSNLEIGARLYVSPRTVEYHLHKVFAKLAITSRTELHLVLEPPRSTGQSAQAPARLSRPSDDADGPAA